MPARPPALPAVQEYVASDDQSTSPGLAPTPSSPDGGALSNGLRVDAGGATARDVAAPALIGGARVPKRFGGGFLFWNPNALYAAKTFTARLVPITTLPNRVTRVSFGSSQAYVHFATGGRWALAAPGFRRSPMPAPGLIDQVASEDGRGVMLTEPDGVWTRTAAAASWKPAKLQGRDLVELSSNEDGVWLRLGNGHALRLEADGSFTELASLPESLRPRTKASKDPRWPKNISEAPRERAMKNGVALDERTALVEVTGAFARVDMLSGEITDLSPAVVTAPSGCDLVPVGSDVLAACRAATGGSVVVAGAAGKTPKIEKVFPTAAPFFVGRPGTLAFGGPCDETRTDSRAVVCVRTHDGSWRELGETAPVADAGPTPDAGAKKPIVVTRWVPTSDGNALGLVSGDEGGVYDAAKNQLTRFTNKGYASENQIFYPSSSSMVTDELAVADDGSIVGFVGSGSVRLFRDGRVQRAPFVFGQLRSAGAFAVGRDNDGRLWQSSSWGQEWTEVAAPTGSDAESLNVESCSTAWAAISGLGTGWGIARARRRAHGSTKRRRPRLPEPALFRAWCVRRPARRMRTGPRARATPRGSWWKTSTSGRAESASAAKTSSPR